MEQTKLGKFESTPKKYKEYKYELQVLNILWLCITKKCNYKCLHCYENATMESALSKELSISDYKFFFSLILKKYKVKCVQITGGEPLLKGKKFITDLLELLSNYKIEIIEIFSNLSLVDDDYIAIFKKYNVHIATSLYARKNDLHDKITQVADSHSKTISTLCELKEQNIPFRVGIVIMQQNLEERNHVRNWINRKFNLTDAKKFDIVRPIGRGDNFANIPYELFKERYVNAIKNIKSCNFDNYFYNKVFNSCWGDKLCLGSDGELYPCVMSKIKLGNYKKVERIISDRNSYRFLNKDKIKTCKKCEYRYLCPECRAMYSNSKNSCKKKPYTCFYNPNNKSFEKGEIVYDKIAK